MLNTSFLLIIMLLLEPTQGSCCGWLFNIFDEDNSYNTSKHYEQQQEDSFKLYDITQQHTLEDAYKLFEKNKNILPDIAFAFFVSNATLDNNVNTSTPTQKLYSLLVQYNTSVTLLCTEDLQNINQQQKFIKKLTKKGFFSPIIFFGSTEPILDSWKLKQILCIAQSQQLMGYVDKNYAYYSEQCL